MGITGDAMGMFDNVIAECPKCHGQIYWQSKAGDCELESFEIDSVPMAIAVDINNYSSWCERCETQYVITAPIPTTVRMHIEEI